MPFEIKRFRQSGLDITEINDLSTATRIRLLPEVGAMWHGWLLTKGDQEINLINHYSDVASLEQELELSFRSAKLSPFACRIPEGKYVYEGNHYEFARKFTDGNAIHGLLYNKPFQEASAEQGDHEAALTFTYSYRADDPGYPFDYDCAVTYRLQEDCRVTIETRIENCFEKIIPIVDGWHPYFRTGNRVNECRLQFYANKVVEFDEKLIPTGRLLPYDGFWQERPIGDIALDHSFMLDMDAPQPKCTFFDPEKKIHLHIYPSAQYPILQLYIPPSRDSIAIETLSGAPDAFNNGIGLLLLKPGEHKTFAVTYEAIWQ